LSGNQGVCVLQDLVIVLIIGMIGVFSLIGAKMFSPNLRNSKVKTRKDTAEITLDKINEETITRLSTQLKKESGRANRLQALKDEYEGIDEEEENINKINKNQVTFEEIQSLVNTKYPKYAKMLPLMKDQVMEITKGMSLDQILAYVGEITGDKKSQSGDPSAIQQGDQFRPDYA